LIALFDDGGDKITSVHKIGYSVGKFKIDKIWITDLEGMKGTREDKYNSIEEMISELAAEGIKSPVSTEKGIEVAIHKDNDTNVILVQNYRFKNNKVEAIEPIRSMKLDEFIQNWNNYKNTGIFTTPTTGWVDNT